MRLLAPLFGLAILWQGTAVMAAPADLQALEQAWHRCVREAYARQPQGQGRAGNERNALDECKPHEDAYVAALMADDPDLTGWFWTELIERISQDRRSRT